MMVTSTLTPIGETEVENDWRSACTRYAATDTRTTAQKASDLKGRRSMHKRTLSLAMADAAEKQKRQAKSVQNQLPPRPANEDGNKKGTNKKVDSVAQRYAQPTDEKKDRDSQTKCDQDFSDGLQKIRQIQ